jgi:hypothetical protein
LRREHDARLFCAIASFFKAAAAATIDEDDETAEVAFATALTMAIRLLGAANG